jgi:hypothetical protein
MPPTDNNDNAMIRRQNLRAARRKHADSLKPNSPHAYAWRLGTVTPELPAKNFPDDVPASILSIVPIR